MKESTSVSKRKSTVLLVFLACVVVCASFFVLTSCSLFGSSEKVEPVTVESVTLLKTDADYLESKEYAYNADSENPMAISSGGEFFISIVYNNPKKYAISYVTITPDDEGAQKITSQEFETNKKTNTVIRLKAPTTTTNNVEYSFTIKNIFYNTGSETKRIKFGEDTPTSFTLKVNPTFTMTLNFQNADRRSTSQKPIADVQTVNNVGFGAEMNNLGVVTTDYTKPDMLPTKEGGWVFEGWYTEPNGGGILVRGDDKYIFWSNVTLYAYYTRLFKYEVVELDTPIVHEYEGYYESRGKAQKTSGKMEFHSGVVITEDDSKGAFPNVSIDDTIVDEKVTESGAITATEYPVVKIGKNAFKDKNNIEKLYIGKYVTEIVYGAFDNCNKLANATFSPDSCLKYIGDYAFQDTKSMGIINSFTIPSTVEYIGNFAFRYSGWSNTNNNGRNERILHIYPTYKFIGAKAFFNTGFNTVVFEAGCHYDSQIGIDEAKEIENQYGWTDIRSDLNRIGSNLFANAPNLKEVVFKSDTGENNALNIIPDATFDAGQYSVNGIETLTFAEGIEYIGDMAFNYQEKIPFLEIPASVIEIGKKAFYNNVAAATLTFKTGSKLQILHSECFGNLALIDSVTIISNEFALYGNGPFSGCDRLKLIEFPNINTVDQVPIGFSEEGEHADEVMSFHYYSDLMYGTFATGNVSEDPAASSSTQEQKTYSLPTRVFCKSGQQGAVLNKFKQNILKGKEMYEVIKGEKRSTGTNVYQSQVFVHDIDNIKTYTNPGDGKEVRIALQEIYSVSTSRPIAYSVVFWSERSTNIVLPESMEGLTYSLPITEIAMYSMPTSVVTLTVPANITRFENNALNGCVNLTTVTFANVDTLEYIGDFAFFGTQIRSFTGGRNLKVIGKNAFMRCKALKYVDLLEAAIINQVDKSVGGINRETQLTQYKYEYELDNKDGNPKDYRDTLADGAFQGCSSLQWVALPRNLQQVNNALFTNCTNLRTVIIPCPISPDAYDPNNEGSSLAQTNLAAFYYRNLPAAIYDEKAIPFLKIYVPGDYTDAHKAIFPPSIGQNRYELLDENNLPAKPSV